MELFSSQGCGNCPVANANIAEAGRTLGRDRPHLSGRISGTISAGTTPSRSPNSPSGRSATIAPSNIAAPTRRRSSIPAACMARAPTSRTSKEAFGQPRHQPLSGHASRSRRISWSSPARCRQDVDEGRRRRRALSVPASPRSRPAAARTRASRCPTGTSSPATNRSANGRAARSASRSNARPPASCMIQKDGAEGMIIGAVQKK